MFKQLGRRHSAMPCGFHRRINTQHEAGAAPYNSKIAVAHLAHLIQLGTRLEQVIGSQCCQRTSQRVACACRNRARNILRVASADVNVHTWGKGSTASTHPGTALATEHDAHKVRDLPGELRCQHHSATSRKRVLYASLTPLAHYTPIVLHISQIPHTPDTSLTHVAHHRSIS